MPERQAGNAAKAVHARADEKLSHNLLGQKLGRKGRDTRERILAATERLLAGPADAPISLSAVAREASLGMTTLYLYFNDLTELILAALNIVMELGEEFYLGHLRRRWPDEALGDHCLRFVEAYYAFWRRNSRILHLRNNYVDAGEQRLREHRIAVTMPVIELLVRQMDGDASAKLSPAFGMATVLLTGIERVITVATDVSFAALTADPQLHVDALIGAEARLLELGIRDCRQE